MCYFSFTAGTGPQITGDKDVGDRHARQASRATQDLLTVRIHQLDLNNVCFVCSSVMYCAAPVCSLMYALALTHTCTHIACLGVQCFCLLPVHVGSHLGPNVWGITKAKLST